MQETNPKFEFSNVQNNDNRLFYRNLPAFIAKWFRTFEFGKFENCFGFRVSDFEFRMKK